MVTFRQCGQVIAIYRGGVLQCYWNPRWPDALHRLLVAVDFLRKQPEED